MEFDIEMPTPCQHCGVIFDLHDGTTSELWYPNTIICDSCGDIEEREVELQDEMENLQLEIDDAEWTIENNNKELEICIKKMAQIQTNKDNAWRSRT
jgi:hypothetical protein